MAGARRRKALFLRKQQREQYKIKNTHQTENSTTDCNHASTYLLSSVPPTGFAADDEGLVQIPILSCHGSSQSNFSSSWSCSSESAVNENCSVVTSLTTSTGIDTDIDSSLSASNIEFKDRPSYASIVKRDSVKLSTNSTQPQSSPSNASGQPEPMISGPKQDVIKKELLSHSKKSYVMALKLPAPAPVPQVLDPIDQSQDPRDTRQLDPEKETWVDTVPLLDDFLRALNNVEKNTYDLYMDGEGASPYSRHGTLALTQVHIASRKHTWALDICELGDLAFDHCLSEGGITLRFVLESPEYYVIWFDCRNDSDILFGNYQVHMKAVIDLQIMELVTRGTGLTYIKGLSKCIESLSFHERITADELREWTQKKNDGQKLFAAKGYKLWIQRPLPMIAKLYGVNDVTLMPAYHQLKCEEIAKRPEHEEIMALVLEVSRQRIDESLKDDYVSEGRHRTLAPKEITNHPLFKVDYYSDSDWY